MFRNLLVAAVLASPTLCEALTVDVADRYQLAFGVVSIDNDGVTIHNKDACPIDIKLTPSGIWTYAGNGPWTDSNGINYDHPEVLRFPTVNLGALAITFDGITAQAVKSTNSYHFKIGQSAQIVFNDVPRTYDDNQGALQVVVSATAVCPK